MEKNKIIENVIGIFHILIYKKYKTGLSDFQIVDYSKNISGRFDFYKKIVPKTEFEINKLLKRI